MTFNDTDLCDKTSTPDNSGSNDLVFGRSLFPLMTGNWPTEQEEEMDKYKVNSLISIQTYRYWQLKTPSGKSSIQIFLH